MKHISPFLSLISALLLSACGLSVETLAGQTIAAMTATAAAWTLVPTLTSTFSLTPSATATNTETPTFTTTFTVTLTPTETLTSTYTLTPTLTLTPTKTPSPTYDFPKLMVNEQAHCRYGPAAAYLHAGDLYAGDKGVVWGRYSNSDWLYVKMDKFNYPCWLAPSVASVTGNISLLAYQQVNLPMSTLYGPPDGVSASRDGDKVTVTWNSDYMTQDDDRGYMLDVFVCQNGNYLWYPVSLPDQYHTSYTFTDQGGCSQPSGGQLAAVEKHGYTTFVDIPWPAAK